MRRPGTRPRGHEISPRRSLGDSLASGRDAGRGKVVCGGPGPLRRRPPLVGHSTGPALPKQLFTGGLELGPEQVSGP